MTHIPKIPLNDLERAVLRARRADRAHTAACTFPLGGCALCDQYLLEAQRAEERLECARSQQPEVRHINVDGADRRRDEREAAA